MNATSKDNIQNEPNPRNQKPYNRGNSELEKFKRRLIRAVARMLLHEKRNEDEVWAGLKKETGCDCKVLWNRMHALTMKKLDCLLRVEDRVEFLPKAARMSITDWLLFDTVLVHQDFDVIGITETTKEDKKMLVDLFHLVEKFNLECLAGDKLAEGWLAATLYYNEENRQCTPMLLQRRWYQLKLATRARFYKFWSMYKGVVKRLHLAEPYKPTALQTDIAKRYKPLVIMPFTPWEELIRNSLVVLPEVFEMKEMTQQAKIDENVPDVMCLEPQVETINLDNDSDSDLEYRKSPPKDNLATVTIKQEPKDVYEMDNTEVSETRQEKISNFAEAVMEATAMELDEIELVDDSLINTEIQIEDKLSPNNDAPITLNDKNNETTVAIDETVHPLNKKENNADVITSNEAIIPINNDQDVVQVIEDENNAISVSEEANMISSIEDDCNACINVKTVNIDISEKASEHTPDDLHKETLQIDDDMEIVDIDSSKEPESVLPQITSIFGGVDVSNDNLSKLCLLTAQITNNANNAIIKKYVETQKDTNTPLESESIDLIDDDDEVEPQCIGDVQAETTKNPDDKPVVVEDIVKSEDVKPNISKNTWFGDLSNDIDFADDGIQFVDEGIAYQDEDATLLPSEIESKIKTEIGDDALDASEEIQDTHAIDKKLLMVPVVYTVKLDDMGILPINLLNHVDNIGLIDVISCKSKPVIPKVDDIAECSDEDNEPEIKRVKLSSALLQKPRSRTYNPIQLCKNPDFNTRLKRLNVGFFSSSRNMLLLKACNPLTIDLSKAFEDRLVNGTMYLKANEVSDLTNAIDLTESSQNVSVVPSAMAVQSLIDNASEEIPPVTYTPIAPKPVVGNNVLCQRNKVINLPDISEIRRINQNLLTAEVTPLQLRNSSPQVPVAIVPSSNTNRDIYKDTPLYTKSTKAGPASRTKCIPPKVVDITEERDATNLGSNPSKVVSSTPSSYTNSLNTIPKTTPNMNSQFLNSNSLAINLPKNKEPALKASDSVAPWRSRQIRTEAPWFSTSNSIYSPDTLLALDTLNKMLYLLTHGESDAINVKMKKPKVRRVAKNGDDDVQIIGEHNATNSTNCRNRRGRPPKKENLQKNQVAKNTKSAYCCWSRERMWQITLSKRRVAKHNCPYPLCLCCCQTALVEMIKHYEEHVPKIDPMKPLQPIDCEDFPQPSQTKHPLQPSEPMDSGSDKLEVANSSITDCQDTKSVNQDVAEIIPIVNNNTTVTLPIEENKSPIISDKGTEMDTDDRDCDHEVSSTEPSDVVDHFFPESFGNVVTEEAEISVVTSESSVSEQNLDNGDKNTTPIITTIDTNMKQISESSKKPLFRVKSAIGTYINKNSENIGHIQSQSFQSQTIQSQSTQSHIQSITWKQGKFAVEDNKNVKIVLVIDPPPTPPKVRRKPIYPSLITQQAKPDTTLVIDHNKRYAKQEPNQKIIYLDSKLISDLPTDNPIFLGKNKILLTTAKFPLNFKPFEAFQRNIKQTLALPKGLQLVLSPNGKVSFNLQANAEICDPFMATLPQLLDAVQQQIDSSVTDITTNARQVNTNLPSEIINLSDDETPNVEEKNEDHVPNHTISEVKIGDAPINIIIDPLTKAVQINNLDNTENQTIINTSTSEHETVSTPNIERYAGTSKTSEIISEHPERLSIQNIDIEVNKNIPKDTTSANLETSVQNIDTDAKINEDISEKNDLDHPATSIANTSNDLNENISKEMSSEYEPTITQNNDIEINKNLPNEAISEDPVISGSNTDGKVNESIPKEDTIIKSKNILSDLMAMSGIGTTDVTDTIDVTDTTDVTSVVSEVETHVETLLPGQIIQPTLIEPPLLQPIQPISQQSRPIQITHTPKVTRCIKKEALTPITSLSELKYACSQNGKFFKLDLKTGSLVPINVCMKKLEAEQATTGFLKQLRPIAPKATEPKPVIDLTDDDVPEQTDTTPNSLVRINQLINSRCNDTIHGCQSTNSLSESRHEKRGRNNLRPVKLFRSKVGRPTILERKLKEIQKRILDAATPQQSGVHRKRKQDMNPIKRKTSDLKIIDLNFGRLTLETNKSDLLDVSSDEEPLSQIATRMRAIEKENETYENPDEETGGNLTVDVNSVPGGVAEHIADVDADNVDADYLDNSMEDDTNPSMAEDIDMPIEALEEDLLDENVGDEDCILGV